MVLQRSLRVKNAAIRCLSRRRVQRGVTSIEYALIGALFAVAIIGGVTATGTNLSAFYDFVSEEVGKVACGVVSC